MGFTKFYRVLMGFTRFYLVLLGFAEFYGVLPNLTGFYGVFLGSNWVSVFVVAVVVVVADRLVVGTRRRPTRVR